jgi:diaminopimelate decarboxylase
VVSQKDRKVEVVDVVGPVCETGDFLGRDRSMPLPRAGELLAVGHVGAYGFSMASNYNSRPRPAEVMVDGDEVLLIRERESFEDLVRGEVIP